MLDHYPIKSSSAMSYSVKNSMETGTRFTNTGRNKRYSDMMRRSTYTIKPVKRDSLTRYRAPSATLATFSSGEYKSVTKRDYTYPSASLLRAMNPNPKWIYRSNSDLGLPRHFSGNGYQYFNSESRSSTRTGSVQDVCVSDGILDNKIDDEGGKGSFVTVDAVSGGSPDPIGVPEISNQFLNAEGDDNTYDYYKPLVGDPRERYIYNAQFKRAVEGPSLMEKGTEGSEVVKKSYILRPVRFTDTFNKAYVPRPVSNTGITMRLPVIKRYNTVLDASRVNDVNRTDRTAVYQKPPTFQSLDKDMMRTYDKQAKLKELLQK